ncbi:MAG: hypothetical protein ACOC7T_03360 [Planctomycetota bacterium]
MRVEISSSDLSAVRKCVVNSVRLAHENLDAALSACTEAETLKNAGDLECLAAEAGALDEALQAAAALAKIQDGDDANQ